MRLNGAIRLTHQGVQERDKCEGMGCTQREPFVLYGVTRKAAIVNRCEKFALSLWFSIIMISLYCQNLWTAFSDENSMLKLPYFPSIYVSQSTIDLKEPDRIQLLDKSLPFPLQ